MRLAERVRYLLTDFPVSSASSTTVGSSLIALGRLTLAVCLDAVALLDWEKHSLCYFWNTVEQISMNFRFQGPQKFLVGESYTTDEFISNHFNAYDLDACRGIGNGRALINHDKILLACWIPRLWLGSTNACFRFLVFDWKFLRFSFSPPNLFCLTARIGFVQFQFPNFDVFQRDGLGCSPLRRCAFPRFWSYDPNCPRLSF